MDVAQSGIAGGQPGDGNFLLDGRYHAHLLLVDVDVRIGNLGGGLLDQTTKNGAGYFRGTTSGTCVGGQHVRSGVAVSAGVRVGLEGIVAGSAVGCLGRDDLPDQSRHAIGLVLHSRRRDVCDSDTNGGVSVGRHDPVRCIFSRMFFLHRTEVLPPQAKSNRLSNRLMIDRV